MTKGMIILVNITFIFIQSIMFIILLKRYIEEIKSMEKLTSEEIKKIIKKHKDSLHFLYKELDYSFLLIRENIEDKEFIIKEMDRCANILEDILNKKHIRKISLELINLKALLYDVKKTLYQINTRIDFEVENDYYIKGDYNLLKESFILIIKYYFKNNINIKVKKYGKFYNIEFISNYSNKEIEYDIVIDYISDIIGKHKGIIKIIDKELLKIKIIIPLEKKSKDFF